MKARQNQSKKIKRHRKDWKDWSLILKITLEDIGICYCIG
jgi:hypothetical protein